MGFHFLSVLCHSAALLKSIRFASSALRFAGFMMRSQPFVYGSSLRSSGFDCTSVFTCSMVPVIGAMRSETALTDSTVP